MNPTEKNKGMGFADKISTWLLLVCSDRVNSKITKKHLELRFILDSRCFLVYEG